MAKRTTMCNCHCQCTTSADISQVGDDWTCNRCSAGWHVGLDDD